VSDSPTLAPAVIPNKLLKVTLTCRKRLAQVPKHTQQPPSPPAAVDSEGREGEAGTASPSQWPQTFAASVTHMRVPVAPLAPKHEL
jgi:hypothetical protein